VNPTGFALSHSAYFMPAPKILIFAGSIRTGSMNARLAALAAKEFALAGADTTRISLLDFPMPIYDGDLENRSGAPEAAISL
jgi:chromate reductase